MPQLDEQQIQSIIDEVKATQYIRDRKSHPWVEDGAYDHLGHCTRLFFYNGFSYLVASKMWVDDEVANKRLPEWMQKPWGTYPDMPPKPPKK